MDRKEQKIILNRMHLSILYEDNHLIAVNKPSGKLVQGDKTGDIPLSEDVKGYIKEKYEKPGDVFLGVIHRLDRPVSGVVIFAKTSKALTRMNALFRDKEIQKTYWAIVKNAPKLPSGTVQTYTIKDSQKLKAKVYAQEVAGSKICILDYKILTQSDHYFLLEIKPHTGRYHQIRSQLAYIGSPIKGDLKYGFPRSNPDASISLHARSIEFIHPIRKEKILIEAPVSREDKLWLDLEQSYSLDYS